MKILIQWTRANPQGWEEHDSSDWPQLPTKPDPTGTVPVIDNEPGWPFAICVQGITFSGDHYAVRNMPQGGLAVVIWDDDPDDFPPGTRRAYAWLLRPPAADPRFGGRLNTRQALEVFAEPDAQVPREGGTTDGPIITRDWEEFPLPQRRLIKHGCQVPDDLAVLHHSLRESVDWREWA